MRLAFEVDRTACCQFYVDLAARVGCLRCCILSLNPGNCLDLRGHLMCRACDLHDRCGSLLRVLGAPLVFVGVFKRCMLHGRPAVLVHSGALLQ